MTNHTTHTTATTLRAAAAALAAAVALALVLVIGAALITGGTDTPLHIAGHTSASVASVPSIPSPATASMRCQREESGEIIGYPAGHAERPGFVQVPCP